MTTTLTRDPLSATPTVTLQRADGWLVCFDAGGGLFKHAYYDAWSDAYADYIDPPSLAGQAIGICACQGGIPTAHLTYADISELRRAA